MIENFWTIQDGEEKTMAFNFLGIFMFVLLVISVLGVVIGSIRKNRKVSLFFLVLLLVDVVAYAISYFFFH